MSDVRHPEVQVQLVGESGNAFAILARVLAALRRAGVSLDDQETFAREATCR